jgi:hypothetical protein
MGEVVAFPSGEVLRPAEPKQAPDLSQVLWYGNSWSDLFWPWAMFPRIWHAADSEDG